MRLSFSGSTRDQERISCCRSAPDGTDLEEQLVLLSDRHMLKNVFVPRAYVPENPSIDWNSVRLGL
jgi:hypothetical protein